MVDLLLTAGLKGDLEFLELTYYGGVKNLNDYTNVDSRNVGHMAVIS